MQPTESTPDTSPIPPVPQLTSESAQQSQKSPKFKPFKAADKFSTKQLLIFAVVFAALGGYLIFRSFAATATFVSDTFTSNAATLLESRTGETGATWKKHPAYTSGKAVISDAKRVRIYSSSTTTYYASGVPASANYSVEADVVVKSKLGGAGVTSRTSATANTFYTCRYHVPTGKWELYKFINGTGTLLGSKTATLTVGTTYRLKLTSSGSTQSCAVNGTTIASATDSSITSAGKAGIRFTAGSSTGNTVGLHIDNFKATATIAIPTVTLTANPSAVVSGSASTLTWSSTGATSCTASGAWSGSKATSGTASTGARTSAATYTLTCTGSGGTKSASTTVTILSPIYWGARIDGDVYSNPNDAPWDSVVWDKFEQNTKKKVSMVHFGQPAPWDQGFSASPFTSTVARGAIPLISMDTGSTKLSDIAAGAYDTSMVAWAKDAKAWGKPLMIRLNWEMNGDWYSWGKQAKANPADFVNSWRHIHDVFKSQGATNVTWVWCPNTEYTGSTPLDKLYPGDAYVDWTGMDGYNWGKNPLAPYGWKTFSQTFSSLYNKLATNYPTKPILIAETAASEYGGSKSAWITDALKQLPTNFPKVKAFVWFNWNIKTGDGRLDWQIESSSSAQAAFANGIAPSYYADNKFGSLPPLTKVKPIP